MRHVILITWKIQNIINLWFDLSSMQLIDKQLQLLLDRGGLGPVIVHQAHQVQEVLDAVQVRADCLEVPLPADAGLGTPVAREVAAIHLLAVVAGAEAGGVWGPGEGWRDKGDQEDGDEQDAVHEGLRGW